MLSKVEIEILRYLNDQKLVDKMNSKTIRYIGEGINLNVPRVRDNLNHLLGLEMVAMGFKEKNSNSFYITEKGQKNIPNEGIW